MWNLYLKVENEDNKDLYLKNKAGRNYERKIRPIKKDLTEIKFSQRRLSKDNVTSLRQYSSKFGKYVESTTGLF